MKVDIDWRSVFEFISKLATTVRAFYSYRLMAKRLGFQSEKKYKTFKPQAIDGEIKLSDIEGMEDVKLEVLEVIAFLKNPAKFQAVGACRPKGVLFVGPPGTGKTMMARAIARDATVPFLYVNGSSFEDAYVGTAASKLRSLFAQASAMQPSIIFVDEMDALCPKRVNPLFYGETRQTANQLLELLDGFSKHQIVFIGATNSFEDLDPALLRPGRMDRTIHFNLPGITERVTLLEAFIRKIAHDASIDCKAMAKVTAGFSGADLSVMVNNAAIRCAHEGRGKVTGADLTWACDRLVLGIANRSRRYSARDWVSTALREAAKALIAVSIPGLRPFHKTTIIPHGTSMGKTSLFSEDDIGSQTKAQLEAIICLHCAPRVAEIIALGVDGVESYSSDDLKVAARLANRLVREWGLDAAVGHGKWTDARVQRLKDGVVVEKRFLSEGETQLLDRQVTTLFNDRFDYTRSVLEGKRNELFAIALKLLVVEELNQEGVKETIAKMSAPITLGDLEAAARDRSR